ncbi:hypothetical protein N802_04900 [Knoellia sinensis KCTC 19936]|uniref:Ricin B lectin domain-containing protein n=1 Tax=Knoellia sinensis KCTC 19936 TaxID=1385520 RepID=A0A0A0J536_9MICO|nr:RICIN domain-containing protein [Knoellia sinensis]KGN31202.1 hypothetical protein N802_04900 [Knoellia sinensis KCTC 19936]
MSTTRMARRTSSRLATAAVTGALTWVGVMPAQAQAAAITSIVFNNVSGAPALNADPASTDDVDDIPVTSGRDLFLPASTSVQGLSGWVLSDNGTQEAFDADDYSLTPSSTAGEYVLDFDRSDLGAPVKVHTSAKVPSMFITTGSGLAAIEADKEFEDTGGTMAMVDEATGTVFNGALSEMKGRGNSTWGYVKKPYQIKLPTNTELVPGAGAHKTWILLANYLDASLIRNKVAYDLEGDVLRRAGAMDHSIKGRMIDLFIDGGFRGSYFLTEKVQVGATRLAITDLQKANETANPGLSSLTPTRTTSLAGAPGIREASYVPFTNTPAGFEQSGFLLEMDFAAGARGERSYVITKQGTPFTVKAPEDANAEQLAFVGRKLQRLEDAISSPTGRNSQGEHFSELIDVPSWARYYLVQEMTANDDAFKSSTYMYMDKGGALHAGPVWDADRTMGALNTAPAVDRVHVGDPARVKPRWIHQLLAQPAFRSAVKQAHATVVGPAVGAIVSKTGHLADAASEVERSAALNKLRWTPSGQSVVGSTPARDTGHLRSYLLRRHGALGSVFAGNYTAGTLPANGTYRIDNGALSLDVTRASLAVRAGIQLWSRNGSTAQKFRLVRGSDSYYTITNVNSGLALDVKGGVAANGTNVWQYRSNGSNAQKWRVSTLDGRNYTITSALLTHEVHDVPGPENGFVLDVGPGTKGSALRIAQSTLRTNQEFRLTAN